MRHARPRLPRAPRAFPFIQYGGVLRIRRAAVKHLRPGKAGCARVPVHHAPRPCTGPRAAAAAASAQPETAGRAGAGANSAAAGGGELQQPKRFDGHNGEGPKFRGVGARYALRRCGRMRGGTKQHVWQAGMHD